MSADGGTDKQVIRGNENTCAKNEKELIMMIREQRISHILEAVITTPERSHQKQLEALMGECPALFENVTMIFFKLVQRANQSQKATKARDTRVKENTESIEKVPSTSIDGGIQGSSELISEPSMYAMYSQQECIMWQQW